MRRHEFLTQAAIVSNKNISWMLRRFLPDLPLTNFWSTGQSPFFLLMDRRKLQSTYNPYTFHRYYDPRNMNYCILLLLTRLSNLSIPYSFEFFEKATLMITAYNRHVGFHHDTLPIK